MKAISFLINGNTIAAELDSKVTKRDLYGYPKKIVEKDGVILEKGYISPDGKLITRKSLSNEKYDPLGSPTEVTKTEINGEEVTSKPSSFKEPSTLTKASLTDLIGFNVTDVYPVSIAGIEEGLYLTDFSYFDSPTRKEAYLLVKKDITFLLIGLSKISTWIGNTVYYEFFDGGSEEQESDDMDFDMF